MSRPCLLCDGTGETLNLYIRTSAFGRPCPRCGATGVDPGHRVYTPGLVLRSPNGKPWALFAHYEAGGPSSNSVPDWGLHRMKLSNVHRSYVWQNIHRTETQLDKWDDVGCGDAWDHVLMESEPLTG